MTFGNYYSINNSNNQANFKASNGTVVTGPISAVQKGVETGLDSFVEKVDKSKKKKSTKRAIAVGSTVLVLSGFVMLLNPRYSTKLMQKLKIWEEQARIRMKNNKDNYLSGKFHKGCVKLFNKTQDLFTLVSNGNSLKDVGFQYLCCEENKKITHKNKTIEKIYKKLDKGFTTIFKKPHLSITKWFDSISKKSVNGRYTRATKAMNSLDVLIEQYAKDLPLEKQNQIKTKLAELTKAREHFGKEKVAQRLEDQTKLMGNLEENLKEKWRSYTRGYKRRDFRGNSQHFSNNLTFWAEDILAPQKKQVEEQGAKAVEKLIGNGKNSTGIYDDILDIFKDNIEPSKFDSLEKNLKKASKNLRKANHSECFEYFDKKRDLVLGSAPTDIVTTLFGLSAAGFAIGRANDKEERISRTVTVAIPAVIGLATNLVCAAAMLSGPVGILTSLGVGFAANRIATVFDKHVLGHKDEEDEEPVKTNKTPSKTPAEVQNA